MSSLSFLRRSALWVLAGLQPALFAQGFQFTKIVDQATPRPDGQGLFGNPHTPSTDGKYVVFVDQSSDYALWSFSLDTAKLTRLANTSTAAPGGTGNITAIGQIGGGPYAGFTVEVRNGVAVFAATDTAGDGLYSVPATGGALQRVVNYNVKLPNGGQIGVAGHPVYAFGLNDGGSVVFTGEVAGNAADGTPLADSVYTASVDGSTLAVLADEDHLFVNPLQNPGPINSCVMNFGTVGIGGNSVVFSGAGSGFWGIYSLPVGGPAQGVTPSACTTGPKGPLVVGSGTALPGNPSGKPVPKWDFLQTDGTNVYLHGFDDNVPCCSSTGGGWNGIFSVPLAGGAFTKIVENGDTLPVIGKVTNVGVMFSVDNGGVVFTALNESVSPTLRGVFLYSRGNIAKVFASGDSLNGNVLTQNGNLEIWPQAYKNGVIAFAWLGGIFAAVPGTPAVPPSIQSGGVVSLSDFGGFTSVARGTWIEIHGSNFATTPREWAASDFTGGGVVAPTSLDGVSVTIGGQPAYVEYISPTQVNVLASPNTPTGSQQVVVTNPAGSSPPASIAVNPLLPGLLAPASFRINGTQYVTALFTDGVTFVLPPGAVPGVSSRLAQPGDTVVLYGIGFGPVTPNLPIGQIVSQQNQLASPFQISVGGVSAKLVYDGLAPNYVGLYTFYLVVPDIAATGTAPLTFTVNGVSGTQTLTLAVQK
jgi:uncharacterized protein (TIGR03437 family)